MVLLKIFDIDSDNNESPLSILRLGEHTLGRGSFSNCNDKRISRKHAVFKIEDQNAFLTSIHINPCFYLSQSSNAIKILTKDVPVQLSDGDKFAFLSETWYRIKIISTELNEIENQNQHSLDEVPTVVKEQNDEASNVAQQQNDELQNIAEQHNNELPNNVEQQNELEAVSSSDTIRASCSSTNTCSLKRNLAELTSVDGRKKLKTIEQSLDQLLDNFKSIEDQDFPNGESDRRPGGVIKKQILSSSDDDSDDNVEITKDITIIPGKNGNSSDEDSDDPITDVNKEPMDTNSDNLNTGEGTSSTAVKTETTESFKEEAKAASTNNKSPKSRREKCWYGKECFRKNSSHRENFSHPGDPDYESDQEDDRPECAYGAQCYRTNVEHRSKYRHKNSRPAPKPSTSRKRRRLTQDTAGPFAVDSDEEGQEDPFEASESDASEFDDDEEDSDSDFSGDDDDEKRMFKEAEKFLRKTKH